jgi:hypothetical protein
VRARFSLIFVCNKPNACSAFRESTQDSGIRLIPVRSTESAILRASNRPFDGFLVYHEDVQLGSALASQLKALFLNTPVVLICVGYEVAPPSGIDAVCYANSLDDGMAGIIATLFRSLLIQRPHPANVRLEDQDERPRPFVVQSR